MGKVYDISNVCSVCVCVFSFWVFLFMFYIEIFKKYSVITLEEVMTSCMYQKRLDFFGFKSGAAYGAVNWNLEDDSETANGFSNPSLRLTARP